MSPEIQNIKIPGLGINARAWGPPTGHPVLGMHGWLDNAATFDLIAPYLPNLRLVSVDFPGHGFSDFLPRSANYNNPDRAIQMLQVVDALGWQNFSLIGHSLGGIVAQMMATIVPERVQKVVLIDVFGGLSMPTRTLVDQMRKYYHSHERSLPHSIYPSLDIAAEKRAKANYTRELSLKGARILAEGGMSKVEGGYSWNFDLRLQLPTLLMLTDEQIHVILSHFKSDSLLILGSHGLIRELVDFNPRSPLRTLGLDPEKFKNIQVSEIEGGHHLHLDNPKPVAERITEFFKGSV